MAISKLPDKELKVTVMKVLIRLQRRVEVLGENFSKEMENTKRNR